MNISFGEPQTLRAGCVSFAVRVDDEVIGTATNALAPNRPLPPDRHGRMDG